MVHTVTAETTGSARVGSVSHSMRRPSTVLTAPSVGARIQRHSTATASGEQIHGITNRARNTAVPGRPRASSTAAPSPSTIWQGTTIAMNAHVTSSERPNTGSVSTACQLLSPT